MANSKRVRDSIASIYDIVDLNKFYIEMYITSRGARGLIMLDKTRGYNPDKAELVEVLTQYSVLIKERREKMHGTVIADVLETKRTVKLQFILEDIWND